MFLLIKAKPNNVKYLSENANYPIYINMADILQLRSGTITPKDVKAWRQRASTHILFILGLKITTNVCILRIPCYNLLQTAIINKI